MVLIVPVPGLVEFYCKTVKMVILDKNLSDFLIC